MTSGLSTKHGLPAGARCISRRRLTSVASRRRRRGERRQLVHVLRTAHEARAPLVHVGGPHGQQAHVASRRGLPAGVFEDERHRRRLVRQLEVALGMDLAVGGAAEDAAVHEGPVHLERGVESVGMRKAPR